MTGVRVVRQRREWMTNSWGHGVGTRAEAGPVRVVTAAPYRPTTVSRALVL